MSIIKTLFLVFPSQLYCSVTIGTIGQCFSLGGAYSLLTFSFNAILGCPLQSLYELGETPGETEAAAFPKHQHPRATLTNN